MILRLQPKYKQLLPQRADQWFTNPRVKHMISLCSKMEIILALTSNMESKTVALYKF